MYIIDYYLNILIILSKKNSKVILLFKLFETITIFV